MDRPVGAGWAIYTATASVSVDWCDNLSLNSSTRWVIVNGNTLATDYVSQPPGDCGAHYSSTTTSAASFNLGANTVSGHICDNAANCRTQSWTVLRYAGPVPSVSLAPYSPDLQDYGRCAAACFAATYAQSTVPYFSLDTPRNVTLVYNGDRVDPKPFIHVDVTHGGDGSNLPSYFYLKVLRNSVPLTFLNGETELHFAAIAGTAQRLGGQFNASSNSMGNTGVYPVTVVVGAYYTGTGVVETTVATRVIVVNWTSSGVGRGWSVAGFQRLYAAGDSALIDESDGSASYFRRTGSSSFVSPVGDFSTLTVSGSGYGTTWTRAYPDSTRVVFNSGGYIYSVTDRFGTVVYRIFDGNGRPSQVYDPTYSGQNQLAVTLSYGAYGLSAITDPYARTTAVSVTSNGRLTSITDPDNVSTGFGYDGSLRLSTITDRGGATSTLVYDVQSGKLASDSAPAVLIFGAGMVRPVTTQAAWQRVGVPYGATSGTPFATVAASAVQGSITDAGGHATTFTVNGFGQPLVTTGPTGMTTSVGYTAQGLPSLVTSPTGATVATMYNSDGLPTTISPSGQAATNIAYTAGRWAQPDSTWGAGRRGCATRSAPTAASIPPGWGPRSRVSTPTTAGAG